MKSAYLDLLRQVLDHQILDSSDLPCGIVDDLEMEGEVGKALRVTAILTGPGVWQSRLPRPFARLVNKLICARVTRIPWEEVETVTETINLRCKASELGLNKTDRKAAHLIAKVPGA